MTRVKRINILYGPPGTGKTTIANILPKGVQYISVGALARTEIAGDTTLGKSLSYYLDNVLEYPQDVIGQLMRTPIRDAEGAVLLDGFPKYEREVKVLQDVMDELALVPGHLFTLRLSADEALSRSLGRLICSSCRVECGNAQEDCCKECGFPLEERPDDESAIFLRRYSDWQQNHQIVSNMLINEGYVHAALDAKKSAAATAAFMLATINA